MLEVSDYIIENGKYVFTKEFLLKRGRCCNSGCRNCPYKEDVMRNYSLSGDLVKTNEGYYGILKKHVGSDRWSILLANGTEVEMHKDEFLSLPMKDGATNASFSELVNADYVLSKPWSREIDEAS
jgi:hypothetical protein